ncbi:MAG: carbon-nitrogen hydrolase family protein [Thermodesulfobacteriota bacterium]|nr:carbon-nitrogen hydrolase family protein [Thermodesulfobacteriota bacterium]
MSRLLGLGACQMEVDPDDVQKNLDNMVKQIKLIKYYSPWVKLVVTPELCFQGASDFEKKAREIPNPITEYCSKIAKDNNIYLIPGSIYEKQGDNIYNTCPVFNDKGNMIETYRKMYPWRPHETTISGNKTLVFDLPDIGRIGLCNCYDLWFPELIRDLVFKGARIIIIPTASGTQDRPKEVILCQAAAIQNQCYMVSVNGVGEGGKGQSMIVDPEGNVVQKAGQCQENLISMIDLENVLRSRDYGIAGVTRPMASFFHEKHRFEYQTRPFEQSPIYNENKLDKIK